MWVGCVQPNVIDNHLRRQDGIVTLAQARRSGLSDSAVQRKVRSGRWRRCGTGVYFVDDRPFTPAARIRAAVWSRGPLAVASGLAAAWWLGLAHLEPGIVEVTVPRTSSGRGGAGVRIRRRDLNPQDIYECRGLRVTGPALTVLEASTAGGGVALMDGALQRRLGLPDLQRAQLRNRGRHGATAARRLLEAAAGGARSEAERLAIELLTGSGITGWQANYRDGTYAIDIAFPGQKVAIEIDGWAFHSGPAAFQNDRKRQNKLALRGWTVLRFTWLDLTQHPERVLAAIRAAISVR